MTRRLCFMLMAVVCAGALASAQVRVRPGSYLDTAGLTRGTITLPDTNVVRIQMATPGAIAATPGAAGTLDDGTYAFRLVAVDVAGGTTLAGAEATCVTVAGAGAGSCALTWSAVTGAVSYRVYGSAVGAEDRYFASSALSYTWTTATGATVAALPSANTAYQTNLGGSANWVAEAFTATLDNLGTTGTDALVLQNTTAAAAGAQQISPALRWRGYGWKTNATAASQTVDFRAFVTPVQGAAAPTGYLGFGSAINGGAFSDGQFVLTSAGNVGIGTTAPDRLFHPEVSDAATNVVTYGERLSHITSGTAAANFGVGKEFELENAAGTNKVGATIETIWTDATDATEDAAIVFRNMAAGAAAAETVRISSTGTITSASNIDSGGRVTATAGSWIGWTGRILQRSPADGQLTVNNQAETAGVGMDVNTDAVLKVRNRAQNAYALLDAGGLSNSGVVTMSATAPTIASGFGTTPSIVASNGTAAFTVNVGTGGVATGGVLTMPAATTGWACRVENITAVAANRGDQRTVQTATTTTSATVQNQTVSTGAALAWTASDVLQLLCTGY